MTVFGGVGAYAVVVSPFVAGVHAVAAGWLLFAAG